MLPGFAKPGESRRSGPLRAVISYSTPDCQLVNVGPTKEVAIRYRSSDELVEGKKLRESKSAEEKLAGGLDFLREHGVRTPLVSLCVYIGAHCGELLRRLQNATPRHVRIGISGTKRAPAFPRDRRDGAGLRPAAR